MGQITFKNSSIKFKSGALQFKNNKVVSPTIGAISYSGGQIRYFVTNNDTNTVKIYGNIDNVNLNYLGDLAPSGNTQYAQSFAVPPSGTVLTIRVQAKISGQIDSDVVSKEYTQP